jgi:hypothetical protein
LLEKFRNQKIAYDLPSMKATRAAGIGYGRREIFRDRSNYKLCLSLFLEESPSPTNYNLKSEFTASPTSKAISFGIARDAYSKVYIKENPPRDPCVPGPG